MSGRRSEPNRLPTPVVQRDGIWYCGTDPWCPCDLCGTVRDTAQFITCPVCSIVFERMAREYWERQELAWACEGLPQH